MERPLSQPPPLHQPIAAGRPSQINMTHVTAADETAGQSFHWHYGEVDDKNFQVHGHSLLLVIIVFSLVLFFAIVCLYARWACRYHRRIVTVSSTDDTSSGGVTTTTQPVGLDKVAIESLPVRLHVVVEVGEDAQCPICLSGLVEGEKVKVMPSCEHGFHPECVDRWLKSHPTCPLCRAPLAAASPAEANPLEVV